MLISKLRNHQVLMLRDHKHYRKYCEPRVVSLGPIHHGKPKYQLTESYKLMLADKFIGKTGRTVEELYGIIEDNIKELREYYDEKVTRKYSDEDLAWMLFVDGCATLQFIYEAWTRHQRCRTRIRRGRMWRCAGDVAAYASCRVVPHGFHVLLAHSRRHEPTRLRLGPIRTESGRLGPKSAETDDSGQNSKKIK